jgi:hypothetical protein
LPLAEFNDRFDKVNSKLLTQIASFNPKNSFDAYKFESLMELTQSYPEDFDSTQLKDLARELPIYIDSMRADERFANLNHISELGRMMVQINKHLSFSLIYRLLKLVLVLPIATAGCRMVGESSKAAGRSRVRLGGHRGMGASRPGGAWGRVLFYPFSD